MKKKKKTKKPATLFVYQLEFSSIIKKRKVFKFRQN